MKFMNGEIIGLQATAKSNRTRSEDQPGISILFLAIHKNYVRNNELSIDYSRVLRRRRGTQGDFWEFKGIGIALGAKFGGEFLKGKRPGGEFSCVM